MTIQLSDVTLYYEVVGHGAPCVLVHGAWENHRIFLKTADRLKERFTCYLVDSRGHGRSSPVAFCAAERTPVRLPADTRRRQRTAL